MKQEIALGLVTTCLMVTACSGEDVPIGGGWQSAGSSAGSETPIFAILPAGERGGRKEPGGGTGGSSQVGSGGGAPVGIGGRDPTGGGGATAAGGSSDAGGQSGVGGTTGLGGAGRAGAHGTGGIKGTAGAAGKAGSIDGGADQGAGGKKGAGGSSAQGGSKLDSGLVEAGSSCETDKDCAQYGGTCVGAVTCPPGAFCILPSRPGTCKPRTVCKATADCASDEECILAIPIFPAGDGSAPITGQCYKRTSLNLSAPTDDEAADDWWQMAEAAMTSSRPGHKS